MCALATSLHVIARRYTPLASGQIIIFDGVSSKGGARVHCCFPP